MMRRILRLLGTFIYTACLTGVLFAQAELATITGTVTDASSAVAPNVRITVTNEETNLAARSITNEGGRYVVPGLRPGVYKVQAALPGFKEYVQSGVKLQVNQTARIDVALALGDASEQVTVQSEASVLETETSSRGAVIDQQKMVELPLNGRDYNQLAMLSPGVLLPTPRFASIGFKGVFNVNGNRATQNAFVLDGVDNVSYASSYRGMNMQIVQPSVDALQEFKVQTNGYAAEFGRSAGAIINAVVKSGTNQLHGAGYEFLRNRALDATNFFSNKSGAAKPARLRNQFGGTLGGPIVRNKTFIFGDYEGLRDRVGTVAFTSVPQTAWKNGRFTVPISNPYNPADNGTDFRQAATPDCNDGSGNCWVIPSTLIDPVGQKWVNVAPAPNTGAPGQVDNNYVGVPVTRNRTDQFDVKVDHNLFNGFTIFGRYSFRDTNQFQPAPRPGLAEGSTNDTYGYALLRSQGIALGGTWVINPVLVSETRVGYSRGDYQQLPPNYNSGCPDVLIGLKGLSSDASLCGGLPPMGLPGGNLRRLSRTTSVPQIQTPRSYNIRQSLTWVKGSHTMKFGGEYLHLQTGVLDVGNLLGNFSFTGRFSGQNNQYQGGIADMLLGYPTTYGQDSKTVFNLYQYLFSSYAQDDWRVSPKLTLNIGLRYEFGPPPREENNMWANFDPSTRKFVAAKGGSLFDQALIHPEYKDFAPRIGVAYSATSRTVLRAVYGIFYNHTNRTGREGMLGFNPPFMVLASSTIAGSATLKATDKLFTLSDGVPAGFVDITKVTLSALTYKSQDMNEKNPWIQQFSFGVQQELTHNFLLDVAYVGNLGKRLQAFQNLNPNTYSYNPAGAPVTGARVLSAAGFNNDIQYADSSGISNYNSLQARVERRFAAGFTMLASYTYGKALTDSVDHLATSGTGNGVDVGAFREPQDPAHRRESEYGLSEFDVKHRFVSSAVWQIPYGRNRKTGTSSNKAMQFVLGNWEFSPILTIQSGLGLSVNQSCSTGIGGERRCRPNRLANGDLSSDQRTVDNWIDSSAFQAIQNNPSQPNFTPNQINGNSGIGILRAPGLFNLDFNLSKDFTITERHAVQFRAEVFNAFNHANFSVPGVTLGAGFGQIVSTSTEARIIQFALKYRF